MARRRPRFFFSFRSPFSWLALKRLDQLAPSALDRLQWIPFWDPDTAMEAALRARSASFHYTQMSKAKHLYILQDTKRLAHKLGLTMAWPIDESCRWEAPHLAWLSAERLGLGRRLYEALVEARWTRGENICEAGTLAAIATAAGLEGERLAAAANDPDIRAEALQCLVEAYEDDIFGIPYFRVGRHRFWGADRVADFAEELARAPGFAEIGEERLSATAENGSNSGADVARAYDSDTAGGCG